MGGRAASHERSAQSVHDRDPVMPDELWYITLKPLPDDVPVAVRIRALLKTALRRDRLRCVSLKEPPAATHQTAPEASTGQEMIENPR
jgi:hypothetical protein